MRAYFLKKIPVDWRTALFGLSASGVFSLPCVLVLRALGYQGLESAPPIAGMVVLLANTGVIVFPFAAILFWKNPSLAGFGLVMFLFTVCGFGLLFPAVS